MYNVDGVTVLTYSIHIKHRTIIAESNLLSRFFPSFLYNIFYCSFLYVSQRTRLCSWKYQQNIWNIEKNDLFDARILQLQLATCLIVAKRSVPLRTMSNMCSECIAELCSATYFHQIIEMTCLLARGRCPVPFRRSRCMSRVREWSCYYTVFDSNQTFWFALLDELSRWSA